MNKYDNQFDFIFEGNHVDNSDSIIIDSRNLPNGLTAAEQLELIKKKYPDQRIEIDLIDNRKNYIYYKDSKLLQRLRYFPFFMS